MEHMDPKEHDSHVYTHDFIVSRDDIDVLHDAHVGEYEYQKYSAYYFDDFDEKEVDEAVDYPAYRPCCYCGKENSGRDSFLERFTCTPCGLAEDDEVDAAERRSNRSLC